MAGMLTDDSNTVLYLESAPANMVKSNVLRVIRAILFAACLYSLSSSALAMVQPRWLAFDPSMLQTGDIVFRRGNSVVSRFILLQDSTSLFSHAGIIRKVDGRAFVIHAVADEAPMGQSRYDDVVRMEPLESFLQTDRASLAAVYRLHGDASAQAVKASDVALSYALQRRPFDFHFDLQTPDELYCTELVWRAYREAGIDLVDGRFDQLSMPLAEQAYILPSSLLHSHWLKLVCVLDSTA